MDKRETKGEIEARVSEAMVKFEKEHMGRGPDEVKSFIIEDMIFVRLKGVLTPAERQLANDLEGVQLVKQMRTHLIEQSRDVLEKIICGLVNASVTSLHTDISTRTGERIITFGLDRNIEEKFRKGKITP